MSKSLRCSQPRLAGFAALAIGLLACLGQAAARPDIGIVSVPSRNADVPRPLITGSVHLSEAASGSVSLVFDLPRESEIETSLTLEPRRLIVDLPGVAFLPADRPAVSLGPVEAWRFGLFAPGQSRVVLDLREPALIERTDTLPTPFGVRTVLTISPSDPERFLEAARLIEARSATGTTRNAAQKVAAAQRALEPGKPVAADAGLPLVVIDPGHGGVDVGATGAGGELEKSLVLELGLQLRRKLLETGKVRVEMTRESDTFVPLPERVRIARDRAAALFISIHADTLVGEPGVRGATIYTLSDKASDASAAKLAEKENMADQAAGIAASDDQEDVSDILFDLARRETRQFSLSFARDLMERLRTTVLINKNPHRFAGFRVLKAPDVPSVLLEIGYLSSSEDLKLLTSPNWRETVAGAASQAILRFLAEHGAQQAHAVEN